LNRVTARFVLLLLFSAITAAQLVSISTANFKPSPYPGAPDYSKPTITVQEPYSAKNYNSEGIFYNITIVSPTSWYSEWGERFFGGLTSVGYTIDGRINVTIAPIENQNASRYIYDPTGKFFVRNPDYVELPTSQTAIMNGNLIGLPEGSRTVQFWVYGESKWTPEEERNTFLYPVYEVYTYAESELVSFQVGMQGRGTEAGPFPWLPVATVCVAVAALVAVAVVYTRKRKRGVSPP
jgi:hypothetical protein